MLGRPPKLNWTKSLDQYTVTINGRLHRLGRDKADAETQFDFLMEKGELAERVKTNPSFAEVADSWLAHVQENHDPDRFRLCQARVNDFIAFLGRDINVRELRAGHVEEWVRSKTGVQSDGTRRLYKAMILACLNWAASKKVRLIAKNPIRGKLDLPEGVSRGGEAVWTPEVFKLVLRNVNEQFADFLKVLAWTGARPSTVRRVEAKHYRRSLKLWDLEEVYRGRKHTKKIVRRVWLPPQAVKLVEKLNKKWPEGPIFRNSKGKAYTGDVVTMMMFKLKRRVPALPPGLTVYGLRHTFATRFIVQHPDKLEYLRELLGHRDLTMIRKHYGHLFDESAAMHGVLSGLKTL